MHVLTVVRELRKQQGNPRGDTKAVLRTPSAAMDKAKKKNTDGISREMDTSTSVLGKRNATEGNPMDAGTEVGGNTEKHPRRDALEIALATDLEVVKEHAQERNP